jgi:hypothetical protein
MTLEIVWRVLEDGEWGSRQTLREASGLDYAILDRMIQFLQRWKFVDTQRSPEVLVRRKAGAISPVETIKALRTITRSSPVPIGRRRLAQRVACRICGGRDFNFTGRNQVECVQCHETEWFTIESHKSFTIHE